MKKILQSQNFESFLGRLAIYMALLISAPQQNKTSKINDNIFSKTSHTNYYRGSIFDDNGFIIYK